LTHGRRLRFVSQKLRSFGPTPRGLSSRWGAPTLVKQLYKHPAKSARRRPFVKIIFVGVAARSPVPPGPENRTPRPKSTVAAKIMRADRFPGGVFVAEPARSRLSDFVSRHERGILGDWMKHQSEALGRRRDLISDQELERQSATFLAGVQRALSSGGPDTSGDAWRDVKQYLAELSVARGRQGFTPAE